MKQRTNALTILSFVLFVVNANAQKDAQHIFEGNALYFSGKFPESSLLYSKALEANPNNRKANFNLGGSLYRNAELVKKGLVPMPPGSKITPDSLSKLIYDQAAQNFAVVANSVSNKDTLHQAWHNIGNCYLKKKAYQEAVNAYKKALKYNDKDEETRYNLAYALKNLPKEKQNGGGGSNKQKNKKEEDKKDQQKNAQPQQNQMNKEQAEQLLKALMDSEKKLQDKRKQKAEANTNVEKDW